MKNDSKSKSIDTAHAEIYTICIPGFDAKSSQLASQSHIANNGDYRSLHPWAICVSTGSNPWSMSWINTGLNMANDKYILLTSSDLLISLWMCCTKFTCRKWRKLLNSHDSATLLDLALSVPCCPPHPWSKSICIRCISSSVLEFWRPCHTQIDCNNSKQLVEWRDKTCFSHSLL